MICLFEKNDNNQLSNFFLKNRYPYPVHNYFKVRTRTFCKLFCEDWIQKVSEKSDTRPTLVQFGLILVLMDATSGKSYSSSERTPNSITKRHLECNRVRKSFEGVSGLWGPAMDSSSAGPSKSQKSLKPKPYPT